MDNDDSHRFWLFRELKRYGGLTPLEIYFIMDTMSQFFVFYDSKNYDLATIQGVKFTFPFFLKIFREFLKSKGLKNTSKIINEWKHMIEIVFFSVIIYVHETRKQMVEAGPSWHTILEVSRFANEAQIIKAYRRKAMIYHPDKCINKTPKEQLECEETMKLLNDAKEYALQNRIMRKIS